MKPEETDRTPKDCAEMQQSIEVLKWAQGALKLLPNLPKGKLKEELELNLSFMLNGQATLRGRLGHQTDELIESVTSCKFKLAELDKLKRPGPSEVQQIRDLITDLEPKLESFRESIRLSSYRKFLS